MEGKKETKKEDNSDYSQVDPFEAIGFKAEPGDIYYVEPSKKLSTYPMYIENPVKIEKTIGSYISYTLTGKDINIKVSRRYSDFNYLYDELVQRWPGVYIPRIPPKVYTKNTDKEKVKRRMRLLNRFCLQLSSIPYLYNCEETNLFKSVSDDVTNQIYYLSELSIEQILERMKKAFPDYDEDYDVFDGIIKLNEKNEYIKKSIKNFETFKKTVSTSIDKREAEKEKYEEILKGLVDYEKGTLLAYTNNQENFILNNSEQTEAIEKIKSLKEKMVNPFVIFKNWAKEEVLDAEAMCIAIKGVNDLVEKEKQIKQKLETTESYIKKVESEGPGFFKSFFKSKENVINQNVEEKNNIKKNLDNISLIIKICTYTLNKRIEEFKEEKAKVYYTNVKKFAIMQKESNRVIKDLWDSIKNILNNISPNAYLLDNEYVSQPISRAPDPETCELINDEL